MSIAEYKHKRETKILQTNKPASSSAQTKELPLLSVAGENTPQQRIVTANNAHKPILRPGYCDMKAVPQLTTHHKAMADHKRSGKPPHPGQKPYSGLPGGIQGGLQKPMHSTHQGHEVTQHKEHPRIQRQRSHVLHHTKPTLAKPKENTPTKSREPQLTESKNVEGSLRVLKPCPDLGDSHLAGMEQNVMERIKAEKVRVSSAKSAESSAFVRQPPGHLLHTPSVEEHQSRQSLPGPSQKELAACGQRTSTTKALYQVLYEQYKKNPEALKRQLKLKVQTEPLTEEEKKIWQKLKKKDEDCQKRKLKHEKYKLKRFQPIESHSATEEGNATPDGGPLTVRIKLPPSVRAEISKIQRPSGVGSGRPLALSSDAIVPSPGGSISKAGRKRAHTHDNSVRSDHPSAKLSRKSESHHHQSSHHSSHDSSKHLRRHGKSGLHHHLNSGHKIDEATFQQALSDAVSLVQSGQATPSTSASEKAVPTVTLKRTGVQNGSADSYVAHSSKHDRHKASGRGKQLCFDPSAPVSATPPEHLFDAEEQQKTENHSLFRASRQNKQLYFDPSAPVSATPPEYLFDPEEQQKTENYNTLATGSTGPSYPEMGEIIDDDEEPSSFQDLLSDHSSHQKKAFSQKKRLNINNNLQCSWGSNSSSSGYTQRSGDPSSITHQNAKFEGHKNFDNLLRDQWS